MDHMPYLMPSVITNSIQSPEPTDDDENPENDRIPLPLHLIAQIISYVRPINRL